MLHSCISLMELRMTLANEKQVKLVTRQHNGITVHFFIMYMVVVYNFHNVWTFHSFHCGMQAKIHYAIILIMYGLGNGNMHHEICFERNGGWLWALASVTECRLEHKLAWVADKKK